MKQHAKGKRIDGIKKPTKTIKKQNIVKLDRFKKSVIRKFQNRLKDYGKL